MKKNLFIQILTCIVLLFCALPLNAQIGIGTLTSKVRSLLDVTSVYGTDIQFFYYNDPSTSALSTEVYSDIINSETKITMGTYSLDLSMK